MVCHASDTEDSMEFAPVRMQAEQPQANWQDPTPDGRLFQLFQGERPVSRYSSAMLAANVITQLAADAAAKCVTTASSFERRCPRKRCALPLHCLAPAARHDTALTSERVQHACPIACEQPLPAPPMIPRPSAAVTFGDAQAAAQLLPALPPECLDCIGPEGDTLLHVACVWGHAECATMLLDRGAAVSVRDEDGSTCLHDACASGCALMKLLLAVQGMATHCTRCCCAVGCTMGQCRIPCPLWCPSHWWHTSCPFLCSCVWRMAGMQPCRNACAGRGPSQAHSALGVQDRRHRAPHTQYRQLSCASCGWRWRHSLAQRMPRRARRRGTVAVAGRC